MGQQPAAARAQRPGGEPWYPALEVSGLVEALGAACSQSSW